MAAGFPAKTSFTDGTTLPASDLNDVTGTLNLIKPTAKGDIFVGSAANTYTKLSIGSDGQTLTASSSATTGVAWSTPSASAFTLIQTINMAGAYSFTFSSIPQTYKSLKIVGGNIKQPYNSTRGSSATLQFVPNGWATGSSSFQMIDYAPTSASATGYNVTTYNGTSTYPLLSGTYLQMDNAGSDYSYQSCNFEIDIPEYTNTDSSGTYYRNAIARQFSNSILSSKSVLNTSMWWKRNAALTSITIQENGTYNYEAGSISLYGITG
jgi:hypothetical protein